MHTRAFCCAGSAKAASARRNAFEETGSGFAEASPFCACSQKITPKTDRLHVEAVFDAAFHEYGLPTCIHTDNGAPFASRAPGGLSRLSMRWVKLGITAERSRPATPQDNGRHERMHLTLKQDTLNPAAANPRRQQQSFNEFSSTYNFDRPHEALGYRTPASCYVASPRPMPRRVPELEYEAGLLLRRVSPKGDLSWKGAPVFISEIFDHQTLALRAFHERYYQVLFGPVLLGWLDTHRVRFHRTLPRRTRCEIGLQMPPVPPHRVSPAEDL